MSDIYHVDIQDVIRKCEDIFISLTDRYYISTSAGNISRLEAEKNHAKMKLEIYAGP